MKRTTLTPPPLKIAIVSAILGLGAVSTVHAQQVQQSESLSLEQVETQIQELEKTLTNGKQLQNDEAIKFLSLSQIRNLHAIRENNQKATNAGTLYQTQTRTVAKNEKDIQQHQKQIAENTKNIDESIKQLSQTQNALIEQDEEINQNIQGVAELVESQGSQILQNKTAIEQHAGRTTINEFEIQKNKTAIAKNKKHIKDLARAQLAGVAAMEELDKNIQAKKIKLIFLQ